MIPYFAPDAAMPITSCAPRFAPMKPSAQIQAGSARPDSKKSFVPVTPLRTMKQTMLLALIGFGCATGQTGATDADLTRGRDQANPGAAIFVTECSKCHG